MNWARSTWLSMIFGFAAVSCTDSEPQTFTLRLGDTEAVGITTIHEVEIELSKDLSKIQSEVQLALHKVADEDLLTDRYFLFFFKKLSMKKAMAVEYRVSEDGGFLVKNRGKERRKLAGKDREALAGQIAKLVYDSEISKK